MANKVFVDIVFRKDKKSSLVKETEKEAGKAGTRAGSQFGKGFSRNAKAQAVGINGLFSQMRKNLIGLAGGFLVFRGIKSSIISAFTSMREFSKSIAEVNSILPKNTKLTQDSIETFSRFAGQFGSTSQGQAKAFYSIVSAGVKGTTRQLETLEVANQAAVAGLVDINTASRSLVSSVNAYSKSGLTAQQASDSLFVAVREGQLTFGDLADFLGNTSAIASSAGVSFDELTGTVSALTKGGIETSKATIALRSVLTSLIKPSDDAKKAAASLGLEFGVSAIRTKGLVGFLKDVADKTGGSTLALGKLFGNVRGLSGVLKLVNGDFNDFKRIVDATSNSSGATSEAFNEIRKSTDFKLTQLTSEIKAFGDQLLTTSQGPMQTFITGARQIFKALTPETKEKSVIELAREELGKISKEINRVQPQLNKLLAQDQSSDLAKANKQIVEGLKVRLGELKRDRFKNQAVIKEFQKTEIESEKQKEDAKLSIVRNAQAQALASRKDALLKLDELGLLSVEQVRNEELRKLNILQEGAIAQGELRGLTDEQLLIKKQEFFEREAQLEAASVAQRTAIQEAASNKRIGDATAEFLGMSDLFKRIGISGVETGKILKKGLFDGIGNGFQSLGAALRNGENGFKAFGDAVKGSIANVASSFGDYYIAKGIAYSADPLTAAAGPGLIAAGSGLKILAGFLGASGGSAGGGGGGGGGGAPISSNIESITPDIAEPELQQQGPRVALTIQGNVFDTDDTRKSIVNFLNESFSEDGTTLNNASFA